MIKLKFDFHTHHKRCGHAVGTIREYIDAAIENGLDMIGISDHSPHFYSPEDHLFPKTTMAKSEFVNYIDEVLQLKEIYKDKIDVLLGVESDYLPEYMDFYKQEYKKYPFDYIIGSVHFLEGVHIFEKRRWSIMTENQKVLIKAKYYRLIQKAAKSGMFQILGHIDAMKRPYHLFSDIASEAVDETLRIIAENDIAIEVNTSGTQRGCGWYPSDDILERSFHFGVDVTFGSDAHVPERVGDQFEDVKAKLKKMGYEKWCYFKKQQKFYTPL